MDGLDEGLLFRRRKFKEENKMGGKEPRERGDRLKSPF